MHIAQEVEPEGVVGAAREHAAHLGHFLDDEGVDSEVHGWARLDRDHVLADRAFGVELVVLGSKAATLELGRELGDSLGLTRLDRQRVREHGHRRPPPHGFRVGIGGHR